MEIAFDLKIEDWVAFQEYFRGKKAPLYKTLMPLLVISAVVLVIINIIYLSYQSVSFVTFISGLLLLMIFYLLFMKKRSDKQLTKMAVDLKEKNPEAFGPRTMIFNDNGIDIKTTGSSKSLSWEEMAQYEENKEYFFLYSKKGVVYIVPKHQMNVDVNDFKAMLEEKMVG